MLGPAITTVPLREYFGDPRFGRYLWNVVLVGGDRQWLVLEPFRVEVAYLARFLAYFVAGTALYVFRNTIVLDGRPAIVAGLLSIAALRFGAFHLFFPVLGAYLVAYLGLRRRLSPGPLAHNDYSYGLYLYAARAQMWASFALPAYNVWWFNLLVSVPLGLVCAVASWQLVERPVLAWVRRSQGLPAVRLARIDARVAAATAGPTGDRSSAPS